MVTDDNYTSYGKHFIMYMIFKLLGYTPKTNVILYVNYAAIKILLRKI